MVTVINRLLCWLIVAFVGSVLLGAISKLTKTRIQDHNFAGSIIFRMAFVLYGYITISMLSWVFP